MTAFLRQTGQAVDGFGVHPTPGETASAAGETELAAAARQSDAYARLGLRLTYHWDRDTVILQVAAPPAIGAAAAPPAELLAEYVVG
ncbi:hypothetical protein AB0J82_39100 [Asanoa sp. NPDC049518]|uniref:hypothetical protein n=1 Tax=unclassified Asanoa TaxID=2685164 RepID=UPI0034267AD9